MNFFDCSRITKILHLEIIMTQFINNKINNNIIR